MFLYNRLTKLIFRILQHFAILLSLVTRAEEASILTSAEVIGSNISNTYSPNSSDLISGYYKTFVETEYYLNSFDNEFIIDLQQSTTLHTLYTSNWVYVHSTRKFWYGTVEVRLGDERTAYNIENSVVWPESFDGGFFPFGTAISGRYLTLRRIYLNPSIS